MRGDIGRELEHATNILTSSLSLSFFLSLFHALYAYIPHLRHMLTRTDCGLSLSLSSTLI